MDHLLSCVWHVMLLSKLGFGPGTRIYFLDCLRRTDPLYVELACTKLSLRLVPSPLSDRWLLVPVVPRLFGTILAPGFWGRAASVAARCDGS